MAVAGYSIPDSGCWTPLEKTNKRAERVFSRRAAVSAEGKIKNIGITEWWKDGGRRRQPASLKLRRAKEDRLKKGGATITKAAMLKGRNSANRGRRKIDRVIHEPKLYWPSKTSSKTPTSGGRSFTIVFQRISRLISKYAWIRRCHIPMMSAHGIRGSSLRVSFETWLAASPITSTALRRANTSLRSFSREPRFSPFANDWACLAASSICCRRIRSSLCILNLRGL